MNSVVTDPDDLLLPLDERQREVAEALRGPVCVLAGAGTGKTRAITHRIAYGVATGTYAPDSVLALTFTTRAAGEMRTRLRQLGAGTVQANTFHAAALRQLGHFWPRIVGVNAPAILESKAHPLAEVANKRGLKIDTATLRDLATEVEWRKVSNLSLSSYAQVVPSRTLPGNLTAEQVLELMQGYEDLKDERAQIDMEDVLLLTAGMLEAEPTVAMDVRKQYRFFVVDEYQDVSPLQHHLLNLWLGDRRDLCVVGDASQTIYSFTGATSDYLVNFGAEYPDATLIRLETNYRSTPTILHAANSLMRDRAGALTLVSGVTHEGEGAVPNLTVYPDDAAEARGVAANIQAEIDAGIAPERIAVLYRINAHAVAIEQALSDVGVSTRTHGTTRFYDLPEVKQAILALRGASVSVSGEPLFKSVSDVLRSVGWTQNPPEGTGATRSKWEALNALMILADEAPAGTSFRAFTDDLLARQAAQHEPTLHAVTLSSVHSAKGLEWDRVYVVGLSEGLFPISYASTLEQIAEERRLLYVALTRARKRLSLSWAQQGAGRQTQRERSRFLAEIGTHMPGVTANSVVTTRR